MLLFINPSFEQVKLSIEKPNLVVAVDNSSSIKHLNQDRQVYDLIKELSDNKDLNDKFNLEYYTFGESLKALDSVTFKEKQTNVYKAFNN